MKLVVHNVPIAREFYSILFDVFSVSTQKWLRDWNDIAHGFVYSALGGGSLVALVLLLGRPAAVAADACSGLVEFDVAADISLFPLLWTFLLYKVSLASCNSHPVIFANTTKRSHNRCSNVVAMWLVLLSPPRKLLGMGSLTQSHSTRRVRLPLPVLWWILDMPPLTPLLIALPPALECVTAIDDGEVTSPPTELVGWSLVELSFDHANVKSATAPK